VCLPNINVIKVNSDTYMSGIGKHLENKCNESSIPDSIQVKFTFVVALSFV